MKEAFYLAGKTPFLGKKLYYANEEEISISFYFFYIMQCVCVCLYLASRLREFNYNVVKHQLFLYTKLCNHVYTRLIAKTNYVNRAFVIYVIK